MSPEHLPVLSSDVRRRILDHLNVVADRAAPGESMGRSAADLAEFLGLHVTTVRFHLDQPSPPASSSPPSSAHLGSVAPEAVCRPAPRRRRRGRDPAALPGARRPAGAELARGRERAAQPREAGRRWAAEHADPERAATPPRRHRVAGWPRSATWSTSSSTGVHAGAGDLQRRAHRDDRLAQLPSSRWPGCVPTSCAGSTRASSSARSAASASGTSASRCVPSSSPRGAWSRSAPTPLHHHRLRSRRRDPMTLEVERPDAAQPAGLDGPVAQALVNTRRFFTKATGATVSADGRTLHKIGGREGDSFYRDRWAHDKVVRSTHGVNCTGSCSWKVYVKDGIITWEAQQTDYPSAGPDRPEYEPRGCPAARPSPGTPTPRPGSAIPMSAGCCSSSSAPPKTVVGDPVVAWAAIQQDPAARAAYHQCSWQGWAGPRELGRGRRARRRGTPRVRSSAGAGPDRRLLPDPGDVAGVPCLGRALPQSSSARRCSLLRLVCRPAQCLPADVRRPDRRARVGRLVGRRLPHDVGLERPDDPHPGRTLDDRGPLPRPEGRRRGAGLRRERQVRRRVGAPAGPGRRSPGHGHGPRHPQGVLRRPTGRLLPGLQPAVHRPALPHLPRAGARCGMHDRQVRRRR